MSDDKIDLRIVNSTYGSFVFRGVNVLSDPLDDAFHSLYERCGIDLMSGMPVNASNLISDDFISKSVAYFKSKTNKDGANSVYVGDKYVENLTILPNYYSQRGDIKSSFAVWIELLQTFARVENKTGVNFHKGTAYYFAGGDAIQVNDFESGVIMMHLALKEDQKNNPDWKNTPANSFMTINPDNVSQFHRLLVNSMAELIKRRLESESASYNKSRGGNLTYEEFRKRFLENDQDLTSAARYYFVYSVLRFAHMRRINKAKVTDDIISPLVFGGAIGSLVLVVENLLGKLVPPSTRISMATIVESLGLGINVGVLKQRVENDSFENVLNALIGDASIKTDFEIVYLCRNQIFHLLKDESIYADHYLDITQTVLNTIFYAIEKYF